MCCCCWKRSPSGIAGWHQRSWSPPGHAEQVKLYLRLPKGIDPCPLEEDLIALRFLWILERPIGWENPLMSDNLFWVSVSLFFYLHPLKVGSPQSIRSRVVAQCVLRIPHRVCTRFMRHGTTAFQNPKPPPTAADLAYFVSLSWLECVERSKINGQSLGLLPKQYGVVAVSTSFVIVAFASPDNPKQQLQHSCCPPADLTSAPRTGGVEKAISSPNHRSTPRRFGFDQHVDVGPREACPLTRPSQRFDLLSHLFLVLQYYCPYTL